MSVMVKVTRDGSRAAHYITVEVPAGTDRTGIKQAARAKMVEAGWTGGLAFTVIR